MTQQRLSAVAAAAVHDGPAHRFHHYTACMVLIACDDPAPVNHAQIRFGCTFETLLLQQIHWVQHGSCHAMQWQGFAVSVCPTGCFFRHKTWHVVHHNVCTTMVCCLLAGNLLKPMLGRGELRCIGATTLDEYRKYIEKDPALERRFQQVYVDQPSVTSTIAILRGLRERYVLGVASP